MANNNGHVNQPSRANQEYVTDANGNRRKNDAYKGKRNTTTQQRVLTPEESQRIRDDINIVDSREYDDPNDPDLTLEEREEIIEEQRKGDERQKRREARDTTSKQDTAEQRPESSETIEHDDDDDENLAFAKNAKEGEKTVEGTMSDIGENVMAGASMAGGAGLYRRRARRRGMKRRRKQAGQGVKLPQFAERWIQKIGNVLWP